jgi:hypothetical protein
MSGRLKTPILIGVFLWVTIVGTAWLRLRSNSLPDLGFGALAALGLSVAASLSIGVPVLVVLMTRGPTADPLRSAFPVALPFALVVPVFSLMLSDGDWFVSLVFGCAIVGWLVRLQAAADDSDSLAPRAGHRADEKSASPPA